MFRRSTASGWRRSIPAVGDSITEAVRASDLALHASTVLGSALAPDGRMKAMRREAHLAARITTERCIAGFNDWKGTRDDDDMSRALGSSGLMCGVLGAQLYWCAVVMQCADDRPGSWDLKRFMQTSEVALGAVWQGQELAMKMACGPRVTHELLLEGRSTAERCRRLQTAIAEMTDEINGFAEILATSQ